MIVRKSKDGYHIIYQAAHGLLAGKIALQLKKELHPSRWLETVIAVIEHDDQQLNFDEKKYVSDEGIPIDFQEQEQTVKQTLERSQRVFYQAKSKSLWTAMLVSFHLDFLYGELAREYKTANRFFTKQQKFRTSMFSHFNITKKEAVNHYQLLLFCDRLSLILCRNKLPDESRKLEINQSIGEERYFIYQTGEQSFCVEPWCFKETSFNLSVEESFIKRSDFKDQNSFRQQLSNTSRQERVFRLSKA